MANEALGRHPALRPRRLTVTGGTDLTPENAAFCGALGVALAEEPGITIITGGFRFWEDRPTLTSADWSTIEGCLSVLGEERRDLERRIETQLAGKDFSRVRRFKTGFVRYLPNCSPEARRFSLVVSADALVAIQGNKGTRQLIDLALTMEKPVLPLPFTGGIAKKRWFLNRDQIRQSFNLTDEDCNYLENPRGDHARIASKIRRLLFRGIRRRCFVMMSFKEDRLSIYQDAIRPAVESMAVQPVRADQLSVTGDAVSTLRRAITESECAIADITDDNGGWCNPNVLYELGLAHAQDKPVVILAQRDRRLTSRDPELPFDVKTQHILIYDRDMKDLQAKLVAFLQTIFG